MTITERRKYIRIDTKKFVKHTKFKLFAKNPDKLTESLTKNLSAGGILFQSDTLYLPGDLVRIEIDVPGWERYKTGFKKPGQLTKSEPVTVLAKVIRVEIKSPMRYEIRAAFVGIDDDHQKALAGYLKSYMTD